MERPRQLTHICKPCLETHYDNSWLERESLGDCVECGRKTVGFQYEPAVLRRKKEDE